jgi:hypothetical protein
MWSACTGDVLRHFDELRLQSSYAISRMNVKLNDVYEVSEFFTFEHGWKWLYRPC